MNDKEKQIEEMAREIQKSVDGCANYWAKLIATYLYEQGYRNCKDKVVLDKEEYDELRQERSDYITELQETHNENCKLRIELEDIRKETAREIIEYLRDDGRKYEMWYLISKLRKQYGVEVE
jgi:hypothetical protein